MWASGVSLEALVIAHYNGNLCAFIPINTKINFTKSTASQSRLVYLEVGASETGLTAVGKYGVIAAFSITAKVKP